MSSLHGAVSASILLLAAACSSPRTDPHPGATWTERLERAARSSESWQVRSDEIRRQILVASGLWPEPERPPVSVEMSGRVVRDGYSVERVHLETLPGFRLTGTLYRPLDDDARHPAVLAPHGHWKDGRFTDHRDCSVPGRAIQLARLGIVAFTYDMVGFGDLAPLGHEFGDPAWGISLQGLQLWNSLRAVDFLCSLPCVDPERIGATGESGGGTQTFLLAAVDPRIQVSIPVNMVAAAFQGGCLCENAPLLRLDLNNVEIAAAIAPRPLMLVSCTGDWTADTPTLEAPVVQSVYAALGAADRFRCVRIEAGHNYNRDSREVAYAWLARWLLDAPAAERIAEAPFRAEPRESMSLPVVGRLDEVAGILRARKRAQIEELRPRDGGSLARYRELYRPAWQHTFGARRPGADEIAIAHDGNDLRVSYAPLRDEIVLVARAGGTGARIWVAASDEEARRAPDGTTWLLRLQSHALEPACNDGLAFRDPEWKEPLERFPATYHRTELARRVQDVLTALAAVPGAELGGVAEGGAIVLLARALAPGPAVVDLEGVDESALGAQQPGFLALGGLRGAALLSAGQRLSLHRAGFDTAALQEAWNASGSSSALRVD